MTDRYFPNVLPDFASNSEAVNNDEETTGTVKTVRSIPYQKSAQTFLQAAIRLKQKLLKETWSTDGRQVNDFTLYTGKLGTAYLLLKSYQVTNDKNDLGLCNEIIRVCDAASSGTDYITFICGRAGICALGAVGAKYSGEKMMQDHYVKLFKEISIPAKAPNELLYGRAGYLWACTFLKKHIGEGVFPLEKASAVVNDLVAEGRSHTHQGCHGSCPLMYEWHGKKYWGAAHGLAGIMHVLLDFAHDSTPQVEEYVKGTLGYMIANRLPSGNYPSSEGRDADRLVHWCHGAPGIALTLTKAYQVFEDEQLLQAAEIASDVVWNRGLLRRVGLCHGVSGNAYVFLSLYRATGNAKHLFRAMSFASFALDRAESLIKSGEMHGGDHPYSLFEGQGGMAALFFDVVIPSESRFPGYEV